MKQTKGVHTQHRTTRAHTHTHTHLFGELLLLPEEEGARPACDLKAWICVCVVEKCKLARAFHCRDTGQNLTTHRHTHTTTHATTLTHTITHTHTQARTHTHTYAHETLPVQHNLSLSLTYIDVQTHTRTHKHTQTMYSKKHSKLTTGVVSLMFCSDSFCTRVAGGSGSSGRMPGRGCVWRVCVCICVCVYVCVCVCVCV